ncbi:MAG: hypothetical protein FRX49_00483 [Trebouxia sp. A1-2]|nr:MAG: hypothetical protein FRX49_00483 [Trebouxia sp. A1-2]
MAQSSDPADPRGDPMPGDGVLLACWKTPTERGRGDHDSSLNLRHRVGNPLEVDPGIVGVGLLHGVCNAALVELNAACQLLVDSGASPPLTGSPGKEGESRAREERAGQEESRARESRTRQSRAKEGRARKAREGQGIKGQGLLYLKACKGIAALVIRHLHLTVALLSNGCKEQPLVGADVEGGNFIQLRSHNVMEQPEVTSSLLQRRDWDMSPRVQDGCSFHDGHNTGGQTAARLNRMDAFSYEMLSDAAFLLDWKASYQGNSIKMPSLFLPMGKCCWSTVSP